MLLVHRSHSPVLLPAQAPSQPNTSGSVGKSTIDLKDHALGPYFASSPLLCIRSLTNMCQLQTALLSVSVGTTCTFYQPLVVLEALALTAAIVVALTVYTFNAARKGANFR